MIVGQGLNLDDTNPDPEAVGLCLVRDLDLGLDLDTTAVAHDHGHAIAGLNLIRVVVLSVPVIVDRVPVIAVRAPVIAVRAPVIAVRAPVIAVLAPVIDVRAPVIDDLVLMVVVHDLVVDVRALLIVLTDFGRMHGGHTTPMPIIGVVNHPILFQISDSHLTRGDQDHFHGLNLGRIHPGNHLLRLQNRVVLHQTLTQKNLQNLRCLENGQNLMSAKSPLQLYRNGIHSKKWSLY